MDIEIKIDGINLNISSSKMHKMIFLFNALENGWTIKKRNKKYIFTKNHKGKRELFREDYLSHFIKDNSTIDNLMS